MSFTVWRLTWYHSGHGRMITADYGTLEQAEERRTFILAHGDECAVPVKTTRAMPGASG